MQIDQTIVFIEAVDGLLREQESLVAMVVTIFQHITGKNCGNTRPNNNNYAWWSMCRDEYRHRRFMETNATASDNDRSETTAY
jgi:hypothetical protein